MSVQLFLFIYRMNFLNQPPSCAGRIQKYHRERFDRQLVRDHLAQHQVGLNLLGQVRLRLSLQDFSNAAANRYPHGPVVPSKSLAHYNRQISGRVNTVFITVAVDLGLILGQVKPKTIKMVFTAFLLDFQHMKGQCEASTVGGKQVAA